MHRVDQVETTSGDNGASSPDPTRASARRAQAHETPKEESEDDGAWPASLRRYLQRAFDKCDKKQGSRQHALLEKALHRKVTDAMADNAMLTKDWDNEPLPRCVFISCSPRCIREHTSEIGMPGFSSRAAVVCACDHMVTPMISVCCMCILQLGGTQERTVSVAGCAEQRRREGREEQEAKVSRSAYLVHCIRRTIEVGLYPQVGCTKGVVVSWHGLVGFGASWSSCFTLHLIAHCCWSPCFVQSRSDGGTRIPCGKKGKRIYFEDASYGSTQVIQSPGEV